MAQQYAPNVLYPETRSASDAARAASSAIEIKPRRKYVQVGSSKSVSKKTGGNSGNTGKKYRSKMRGHAGGQLSTEERNRREAQGRVSRENQVPRYVR